MSLIETKYDSLLRRFEITGCISERDIAFSATEAVLSIKRQLVSSIVDHIMERLSPELDKAIEEAFKNFGKERE